ncbi:MAG TPA: prephenate dehydratase [Solirubrobacteraceae bacterium]|nr:prephenate dehydratase [Solirubrobacteraceae bacterium]
MRIAYLGPPGTFSEQALHAGAPAGAQAVALPTVHDAVMAVAEGRAERAVVPMENSLEGSVRATLDTLAGPAEGVAIVGEALLGVSQALLARPGVVESEVEAVTSHPQALAQCERTLRERLAGAELVPVASTAEAARRVAAEEVRAWAALGPAGAAERYGLAVLDEGMEDEPGNVTRFVWLAPAGTPPEVPGEATRRWRTTIAFFGAGDQAPGWLVRCLSEFAFRGVNLSRIESRPYRGRLGHYRFFADLEGHADDEAVAGALAGLRRHCEWIRILGSYPAA